MSFNRLKKRLIDREDYRAGNFFNRIWPEFLGDFAECFHFENGRIITEPVHMNVNGKVIQLETDDHVQYMVNYFNKYWIDYCEFRLKQTGVEVNGDYFRRKAENHIHDMKVVNFYFAVKKCLKEEFNTNADDISTTPGDFYHDTMSVRKMALRQWASLNPFRLYYITTHAHHRTA